MFSFSVDSQDNISDSDDVEGDFDGESENDYVQSGSDKENNESSDSLASSLSASPSANEHNQNTNKSQNELGAETISNQTNSQNPSNKRADVVFPDCPRQELYPGEREWENRELENDLVSTFTRPERHLLAPPEEIRKRHHKKQKTESNDKLIDDLRKKQNELADIQLNVQKTLLENAKIAQREAQERLRLATMQRQCYQQEQARK